MTTYLWDFGDGNTSTLQYPTHTYTAIGTFTVTLSIDGGAPVVKEDYVTSSLPPFTWFLRSGYEIDDAPEGANALYLADYTAWAALESKTVQPSYQSISPDVPAFSVFPNSFIITVFRPQGSGSSIVTNNNIPNGSTFRYTEWQIGTQGFTAVWQIVPFLLSEAGFDPDTDFGGYYQTWPGLEHYSSGGTSQKPFGSFSGDALVAGDAVGVLIGYDEVVYFINGVFAFRAPLEDTLNVIVNPPAVGVMLTAYFIG